MAILTISEREVLVDDDLYDDISQLKWCINGRGYAMRGVSKGGKNRSIFMHRYVLELKGIDIPVGMIVDHINRSQLDNRFENLRVVTYAQNIANTQFLMNRYKHREEVHMKASGANKLEKPKTTEPVNMLFPIPIKRALIIVAVRNGLLLSDIIRMVVMRHTSEDFPEFYDIVAEETENFNQKLSETK